MIPVTRIDGSQMVVNDDQIAWIETHHDTVIAMMNGEKLIVREPPDVLVDRTRDFRRSVHQGSLQMARAATGGSAQRLPIGRSEVDA